MADAMYAPVCTRFVTYDVELDPRAAGLRRDDHGRCPTWSSGSPAAQAEPDELEELEVEF